MQVRPLRFKIYVYFRHEIFYTYLHNEMAFTHPVKPFSNLIGAEVLLDYQPKFARNLIGDQNWVILSHHHPN